MTFEETKAIIKEFLDCGQRVIGASQTIFLAGSINIIYEDLEILGKNEKVYQDPAILQGVLDSLIEVSDLALTAPLHNRFLEFLSAYSELVFNWNNNTYKDKTVFVLVKFINSTVNSKNIMMETIRHMKVATDKLEVMRSWSPASYDIALAYVDEQLKINEK